MTVMSAVKVINSLMCPFISIKSLISVVHHTPLHPSDHNLMGYGGHLDFPANSSRIIHVEKGWQRLWTKFNCRSTRIVLNFRI